MFFPITLALSHNYADDAWTSNACQGHNFHHRDLKFSDVVPKTITNFNHNQKKIKILISTGAVPLNRYGSDTVIAFSWRDCAGFLFVGYWMKHHILNVLWFLFCVPLYHGVGSYREFIWNKSWGVKILHSVIWDEISEIEINANKVNPENLVAVC